MYTGPGLGRPKTPSYEGILDTVHDVLVADNAWITDDSRKNAAQSLDDCSQGVTGCGSEAVTTAFFNLQKETAAYAAAPSLTKLGDQLWALEDLLLSIRNDLGHTDQGLERGDLLLLFVEDINKYLAGNGAYRSRFSLYQCDL